ncbi:linear amide C-N hydrolase [Azospirillum sp. B21]|uniref:linear amide C-N hydrolase n=1 Tax=Azospirillum sp. B21 TaxID=2607496 RepID=UPI0011EFFB0D|nr:linear amide C-N hydrolase [Azospirillum sp. B21]
MCTDFMVVAKDQTCVNGRSMDFEDDLISDLIVHAPGKAAIVASFVSDYLSSQPGGSTFKWLARKLFGAEIDTAMEWIERRFDLVPKYGYVGMTVKGYPLCADGMNSQGLSVGALWLTGTKFQEADLKATNVVCGTFVDWMLGHCATVAEVRELLESHKVHVTDNPPLTESAPLHFAVHDAEGKSIVIEFIDGKAVISDNPVKVLTNLPTFSWHLTNLATYINLTQDHIEERRIGDFTVRAPSPGTGLIGLPGDATAPSRFVRTALLKEFAERPKNAADAHNLAFHLLNAVHTTKGVVRAYREVPGDKPKREEKFDHTQWAVVKDLTNRVITIRMAASQVPWSLDLKTLQFDANHGRRIAIPTDVHNRLPL